MGTVKYPLPGTENQLYGESPIAIWPRIPKPDKDWCLEHPAFVDPDEEESDEG